jgi:hypothetical protein
VKVCRACGGDLRVLGMLGSRAHYRCRSCGLDSSNLRELCQAHAIEEPCRWCEVGVEPDEDLIDDPPPRDWGDL